MKKSDTVNQHSQLIIDVIIEKFVGFHPLYRQLDTLNKMGVILTKGEIIDDIVYLSEKLRPIYDDFLKEIRCSKRVFGGCLPVKSFSLEKCFKKNTSLKYL